MKTQPIHTVLATSMRTSLESNLKAYRPVFTKIALVLIALLFIALAATLVLKPAASLAEANSAPRLVYDATAAMRKAVVYSWEAPATPRNRVYDATAAMRKAVVYSWEMQPVSSKPTIVYDATGAMLDAVVFPLGK